MKSILEGRPALSSEVEKIAEVAGYLWQNGWAERNGGNITVNVTEYADEEMKAMPAISDVKQIGVTLPALKGCYFYCKGTGTSLCFELYGEKNQQVRLDAVSDGRTAGFAADSAEKGALTEKACDTRR